MRERIITAYMELAYTKGFYNATVDEMAQRAGLSKRTIYRYFNSKDEIVEAVVDRFILMFSTEIESIMSAAKPPEVIFSEVIDCFFRAGHSLMSSHVLRDLNQHYPHLWKKIDELRLRKVQGFFRVFLNNSDPELVRQLNPNIVTTAVIASIQAVLNPEYLLARGLTLHEAGRQLLEFFMHGFLKDEGKERVQGRA